MARISPAPVAGGSIGGTIRSLVSLTRGDYAALPTKDPNTLYLVTGGVATGGIAPANALVDDFTGTSGLWQLVRGAATVTGGNLDLTPAFSADGSAYTTYQTVASYDLSNTTLAFKIAQLPTGNESGDLNFAFGEAYTQNCIQMQYEANVIYLASLNGTTATDLGSHAVNITATPWWRFRHNGTTIFFEISSDGSTYTQIGSVAASSLTWPVTAGKAIIQAGYYDNTKPAPVHALVAGVNAP